MAGSVRIKIGKALATVYTLTLATALGSFLTESRAHSPERVLVAAYELDRGDVELLATTMWGEARSQGDVGMLSVGFVVLNRQGKRKSWTDISSVVKSPRQFSMWNKNDPNFKKISYGKTTKEYKKALQLAEGLLRNRYDDPTQGATYYHAKHIRPYWAKHMERTVVIGDHIFYKE